MQGKGNLPNAEWIGTIKTQARWMAPQASVPAGTAGNDATQDARDNTACAGLDDATTLLLQFHALKK